MNRHTWPEQLMSEVSVHRCSGRGGAGGSDAAVASFFFFHVFLIFVL